ncbi:MAG: phosphatidylserine decarboxylase [Planctomycetes bacterium]|nr:phosphatidylserine decarboxylase [Planctomycetota bacterium]
MLKTPDGLIPVSDGHLIRTIHEHHDDNSSEPRRILTAMKPRTVLTLQVTLLLICAGLVLQFASSFPYPGPVVRPFLGPKERWPEQQIRAWAKNSQFRSDFWEFFTRDPVRTLPSDAGMLAPADGLFRFHEWRDGTQYVVIALSFWDVHFQWCPCDGEVLSIEDRGDTFMDGEGKAFAYLHEKVCPVQKIITLQTAWGTIRIRLITSISARRLKVFVTKGQKVKRGQKLGQILAGSTVVVELPSDLRVLPAVNTRMVGSETVLVREKVR